jgi:hypothetical protein
MLAALLGGLLIASVVLMQDGDEAVRPAPSPIAVPDASDIPSAVESEVGTSPAPPLHPSLADLQLALEAATTEREFAEAAVVRAQSALEAAEEQLEFRLEQGEDADALAADAAAMIEEPFAELQDALRRLDQAEASETALRDELTRAAAD